MHAQAFAVMARIYLTGVKERGGGRERKRERELLLGDGV